jgi:hypothetical protein
MVSNRIRRQEAKARPEPTLDWVVAEVRDIPTGSRGRRESPPVSRPTRTGITKERLHEIAQEAGVELEWARNGQGRIAGTDLTYTTHKKLYGRIAYRLRKGRS